MKGLLAGVGVTFFQQATGQPTVLYYSTKVFETAFSSHQVATLSSLVVALVKMAMTVVSVWQVWFNGFILLNCLK